MTEDQSAASQEAVTDEALAAAQEAADATPEQSAEEQERVSKSKERRERQKAKVDAAHKEAEAARKEHAEMKAKLDKAKEAGKGETRPKDTDFADPDEYYMALGAFHAARTMDARQVAEIEEKVKAEDARARELERNAVQAVEAGWREQVEDGAARYADFEAVVTKAPISDALAWLIKTSEQGADIAYHLGQHHDEAKRLSGLHPIEQARELGRLEARLSAPQPKRVSDAPDPVNPIRSGARGARSAESMSYEDFCKARAEGWSP